jgi:hypothetical protein
VKPTKSAGASSLSKIGTNIPHLRGWSYLSPLQVLAARHSYFSCY